MPLQLDIVTPQAPVFSEPVDAVTLPTANGETGILPGHAALVSALGAGVLSYTRGGETQRMVVSGGFVEINQDQVSVLAEVAENAADIDADAARAELQEAQAALNAWTGGDQDAFDTAKTKLDRAQARLQLTSGGR
jgi:F-type H+-transporting ATPase subunit epsilon